MNTATRTKITSNFDDEDDFDDGGFSTWDTPPDNDEEHTSDSIWDDEPLDDDADDLDPDERLEDSLFQDDDDDEDA